MPGISIMIKQLINENNKSNIADIKIFSNVWMVIGRKAHTKIGNLVRLFDNSCDC